MEKVAEGLMVTAGIWEGQMADTLEGVRAVVVSLVAVHQVAAMLAALTGVGVEAKVAVAEMALEKAVAKAQERTAMEEVVVTVVAKEEVVMVMAVRVEAALVEEAMGVASLVAVVVVEMAVASMVAVPSEAEELVAKKVEA